MKFIFFFEFLIGYLKKTYESILYATSAYKQTDIRTWVSYYNYSIIGANPVTIEQEETRDIRAKLISTADFFIVLTSFCFIFPHRTNIRIKFELFYLF